MKNHQISCLNKLNSKEIYSILIESDDSKTSSQLHNTFFIQNSNLDWRSICAAPYSDKRLKTRVFQHKLLNNVLYLNKILFRFVKIDSPLYSFSTPLL